MRIAIIGGGIFGCTCAIRLGNNNLSTTIFEEKDDILLAASRVNQYRLHQGYHYPRSSETVRQVRDGGKLFIKEYKDSIYTGCQNLYAIASQGSHVNSSEYLEFLEKHSLKYKIIKNNNLLVDGSYSLLIEAEEALIDYQAQKKIVKERLTNNKYIKVKLNKKYSKDLDSEFDFIVNCTYGMGNHLLPSTLQKEYKYQLLEKIVVAPPKSLLNKSLVIVDGPFMCIDPIPQTNLSVLGNVVHAIHKTNHGNNPSIENVPIDIKPWQDIKKSEESRFNLFISHAKNYIQNISESQFKYSMVGYRVLIPGLEKTDERLTSLQHSGKYINIFSGKIDTCSWAAEELLKILKKNF